MGCLWCVGSAWPGILIKGCCVLLPLGSFSLLCQASSSSHQDEDHHLRVGWAVGETSYDPQRLPLRETCSGLLLPLSSHVHCWGLQCVRVSEEEEDRRNARNSLYYVFLITSFSVKSHYCVQDYCAERRLSCSHRKARKKKHGLEVD